MTKTVGANRKTLGNGTIVVAEKANTGSQVSKKTRLEMPNDVQQNQSIQAASKNLTGETSGKNTPRSITKPPATVATPTQNTIKTSAVYRILCKKERTLKTLNELNCSLKNKENLQLLNANDPALDGTFLHLLTQTAQANDE